MGVSEDAEKLTKFHFVKTVFSIVALTPSPADLIFYLKFIFITLHYYYVSWTRTPHEV